MSQNNSRGDAMKIEDLFSVRGKIVLITGGSRGLGEMMARAYVENGAKVYISARNVQVCAELAKELSAFGECIAIPADLSSWDKVMDLNVKSVFFLTQRLIDLLEAA